MSGVVWNATVWVLALLTRDLNELLAILRGDIVRELPPPTPRGAYLPRRPECMQEREAWKAE